MEQFQLNTIDEAIEDIRNGKFVIVVDDEDRENEGDFICAAELITPEKVNFMITNGRGLVCAPLTEERCDELSLPMQAQDNTSMIGKVLSTQYPVLSNRFNNGRTHTVYRVLFTFCWGKGTLYFRKRRTTSGLK